jgi:ABC-2 type transport system permease protein
MIGGYAIMFLLFATTGSAASLFEERNDGIFLRLLSMPVKRTHILWSKFIFNTILGVVQALTLFVASSLLFRVDVFPNFLNLFVVSLFASAACTAFGMFLASVSKTPQQAQGFGTLLIISMSALGGAWFPLSMMPEPMQVIGKFTLVYWGVESYLGALWEEAGLFALIPQLGVLAGIALALNLISTWRFKTGDLFR